MAIEDLLVRRRDAASVPGLHVLLPALLVRVGRVERGLLEVPELPDPFQTDVERLDLQGTPHDERDGTDSPANSHVGQLRRGQPPSHYEDMRGRLRGDSVPHVPGREVLDHHCVCGAFHLLRRLRAWYIRRVTPDG